MGMTNQPQHSELGASVSHRWINCPATVQRARKFPAQGDTPFTIEGTEMHKECEGLLIAWQLVGFPMPYGYDVDKKFNDEQKRAIQKCVDRVVAVYKDMDERCQYPVLHLERRVGMPDLHPDFYGTADVIITGNTELYLIDFKFGRGVEVDIEYNGKINPQIGYYLLGATRELSDPEVERLDKITAEIIQPRFADAIKTRAVDFDDLFELSKQLVKAAKQTELPDPPAKAGKWCRFCPARATCPEHVADVQEKARSDFAGQKNADPGDLSPQELADLLDDAQVIESWVAKVKEHVLHAIEYDGMEIPGWEAVPKRAVRKWKDPDAARKLFSENITDPDWYSERVMRTPAQIEKLIEVHGPGNIDLGALERLIDATPSGSKLKKKDT